MNVVQLVNRETIALVFSREFESLLLNSKYDHISLSHDLEAAAEKGLQILEELEDVHDIRDVDVIKLLILATNNFLQIDSNHFKSWHIGISADLIDEIDLLILTHGEDLVQLGLKSSSLGSVLLLLSTSALLGIELAS